MKLAVGSGEKTLFNVLCLNLRSTSEIVAREIFDAWFNTPLGTDPTDVLAVEQVARLENKYTRVPPSSD